MGGWSTPGSDLPPGDDRMYLTKLTYIITGSHRFCEITTDDNGQLQLFQTCPVLGFEGQGGLECNQTLNANPQEAANWCNTNSECNGYYTYSKDGTGSEPNAKRVCFKKNIDPTKTPTMTTYPEGQYSKAGIFVLTGEKPTQAGS